MLSQLLTLVYFGAMLYYTGTNQMTEATFFAVLFFGTATLEQLKK